MRPLRLGPNDLLEYEAHYGVLICRECQYAIQKSALQSHLLRHKIYREQRRELLVSIARLHLFEPDDVPISEHGVPAVSALPIIYGYRCLADGCGNLYASSKRMRRHRSEAHGLDENDVFFNFARPAKLQTFFRGTKIRYFEVTSARQGVVEQTSLFRDNAGGLDAESARDRMHAEKEPDVQMLDEPLLPSGTATPPEALSQASPVNIDMEIMAYFHNYTTVTSLILPSVESVRPASDYWQADIVLLALRTRWLLCGLLTVSAIHLAILTKDADVERGHREQSIRLFSGFRVGWKNADKVDEETAVAGERVWRILRCSRDYVVPHYVCRAGAFTEDGMRGQDLCYRWPDRTANATDSSGMSAASGMTLSVALEWLDTLPTRMTGAFGRPDSTGDVLVILAATYALRECCSTSFASTDAQVTLREMETWWNKVPDRFHSLISHHSPAALVVVAHWAAILIRRAERCGCWFLRDSTEAVLGYVEGRLPKGDHAVRDLIEGLR